MAVLYRSRSPHDACVQLVMSYLVVIASKVRTIVVHIIIIILAHAQ